MSLNLRMNRLTKLTYEELDNNFIYLNDRINEVKSLNIDAAQSLSIGNLLMIEDRKPTGTHGGTATAGSLLPRELNTIVINNVPNSSLVENTITLPKGFYWIQGHSHFYATNATHTVLYDKNNEKILLQGESLYARASTITDTKLCHIEGPLLLEEETEIQLRYQCQTTRANSGLGVSSNYNQLYVIYSVLKIWKLKTEQEIIEIEDNYITYILNLDDATDGTFSLGYGLNWTDPLNFDIIDIGIKTHLENIYGNDKVSVEYNETEKTFHIIINHIIDENILQFENIDLNNTNMIWSETLNYNISDVELKTELEKIYGNNNVNISLENQTYTIILNYSIHSNGLSYNFDNLIGDEPLLEQIEDGYLLILEGITDGTFLLGSNVLFNPFLEKQEDE